MRSASRRRSAGPSPEVLDERLDPRDRLHELAHHERDVEPTVLPVLDQLDALAEVDRMPVVEQRAVGLAEIGADERLPHLDRLPVRRVVHVAREVGVAQTKRPGDTREAGRRSRQLELRRGSAATSRLGVDLEPVEAGRTGVRAEVNPDAVHLDRAAAISRHRPAATGGDRRHAVAPRLERDRSILEERAQDVDADAAQDPEMVGRPPAGLVDVVDRRVLEVPGKRVEPHPSGRVHVAEADAALRPEGPPHLRDLRERLQAGNDTRVRSPAGGRWP